MDLGLFTDMADSGVSAPIVWNPALKGPNIALSAANATATMGSSPWESVAGLSALSGTGSFRVLVAVGGNVIIGVCNASLSTASYIGVNANSAGIGWNGSYFSGGIQTPGLFTFTTADIITVDYDIPANQQRFAKNGGTFTAWQSISGVTGTKYPAGSMDNAGSILTGV